MKKYLKLFLVIGIIFMLSGCGNKKNNDNTYVITNDTGDIVNIHYQKDTDFLFKELDNYIYSIKSEKLNMYATLYIGRTTDTFEDSNKYYKERYSDTYKTYNKKGFTYSSSDTLEILLFLDEQTGYTTYYYMNIDHINDSTEDLYSILDSDEIKYLLKNLST